MPKRRENSREVFATLVRIAFTRSAVNDGALRIGSAISPRFQATASRSPPTAHRRMAFRLHSWRPLSISEIDQQHRRGIFGKHEKPDSAPLAAPLQLQFVL
jgi:hypothetical protein